MSIPILHHYVPRFHLARFTDNTGKIWTLDKKTGKIFNATPANLAAENNFYSVPEFIGTKIDPCFLEKQFARLESESSKITSCWLKQIMRLDENELENNLSFRDAFLQAPKIEIPDINREIMSQFIALQFYRTADQREIMKLYMKILGIVKQDISDEEIRSLHAQLLCELSDGHGLVADLEKRIRESIWIFARNKSTTPFLTSDTPVLMRTPDSRQWWKGVQIFDPGMYIVYALNSQIILFCHERSFWKKIEFMNNCLSPILLTSEMVQSENSGHAGLSSRFVFSKVNDFQFVQSFISNESNFDMSKHPL